ncbi:MAG: MBL fold metallo-hydrolase [Anaerolineae bacterium]|jgi:glyoxylase-like metal-dependent hydrolase (beta-lactamase superfamily II)
MDSVRLAPGIFHLQSGSNMGLVVRDGKALLIDAGLDDDAGRRALRAVEAQDATLEAIVVTHAHADHFGGAQFLQNRLGVPLFAPRLEAAMMENPIIEPLYLFGGAAPIKELRSKFTLAEPCTVNETVEAGPLDIGAFHVDVVPLPGHALNQVGVAINDSAGRDVLFCADAIFPRGTIEKHKVLFCVDLDQTLDAIGELRAHPADWFAPGHGPAYAAGEDIERICDANRVRLEEIRETVRTALEEPQETSTLVQRVAEHFRLRIRTPTAYTLTRTTVLAALSSLEGTGEVAAVTDENRLLWCRD